MDHRRRTQAGLFLVLCVIGLGIGFASNAARGNNERRNEMLAVPDDGRTNVLTNRAPWRFNVTWRPPPGEMTRSPLTYTKGRWVRWGEGLKGPWPPRDLAEVDFADDSWPTRRAPLLSHWGDAGRVGAALIAARRRFEVTDPRKVENLRLDLVYRGGVRVLLNGKEVARGHLPKGKIEFATLATPYPKEVFFADGREIRAKPSRRTPEGAMAPFKKRFRELTVDLPTGTLRKGTNVLAIELHRAPIPRSIEKRQWDTVGLVSARLSTAADDGVTAERVSVEKPRAWTTDAMDLVSPENRWVEPLAPVRLRLHAPQNGFAAGQVVVTASEKIENLAAAVSTLAGPDGATIPTDRISGRFVKRLGNHGWRSLVDEQPDPAPTQPMWIRVEVPADATPGTYTGRIDVRAREFEASVPVELTVYGWRLGEPRQWRTGVNILQSPEAVAGTYGVDLWSDRHFELMKNSMRLMGRAGNDVLGIQAIRETVFGDDPVIVFEKTGDGYRPVFTYVERYLKQYDKLAGEPRFLNLTVWTYGLYKRGRGRDGTTPDGKPRRADKIKILELRDGKLVDATMPIYGDEVAPVWKDVMDGLRQRVEDLGWSSDCIILGTCGDCWVSPQTVAMFKKVAPWAGWRSISHGNGAPEWGPTLEEWVQPNGMQVRYYEAVRRITNVRDWPPEILTACNARDCVGSDPYAYRCLPPMNVGAANFDGFCWKGIDYWAYTNDKGRTCSPLNTYVGFGNIVGSTPRHMAARGPDGAVTTVQFEQLLEGIQDTEAVWILRDAVTDPAARARLGPDLAARAREGLEEMLAMYETGLQSGPMGAQDVKRHVRRVYSLTAKVREALAE